MRWTNKKHEEYDTRIKKGFLIFPKRIGEDVRWLEYAVWKEKFYYAYRLGGWWSAKKWINE